MTFTPEQLQTEEWRVTADFPNYWVSNLGRCKSLKTYKYIGLKERILKPQVNMQHGYVQYRCYNEYRWQHCYIHRLVYEAFVGKLVENMVIDHIDNDRENNTVENLQQLNYSSNILKADYFKGNPSLAAAVIAKNMRKKGLTLNAIGDVLGVSNATVHRWIHNTQAYMQ